MALSTRRPGHWWSRLHFLVKLLGLTGLVAAGVGLLLSVGRLDLSSPEGILTHLRVPPAEPLTRASLYLLVSGLGTAAFALLVEALVAIRVVTGRRSAVGMNVALQVALATGLIVGLNVYSYRHYLRFDWTRDRQFTLPPELREQLAQLKDETTIIVYQRHNTFGRTGKPDGYDAAAERKVVEKVYDLVDQFRQLGPQFRVVTLDVEEEDFNDRLDSLTSDSKALREAIDNTPENSIFFVAGNRVQRLSFDEFFQLDKPKSKGTDKSQRNLVLLYQGIEPFVRKVLNIDEKRPRIGLAVIHEWLTSEGPDDFGLAGMRKTLQARGFEVKDIVLRKWTENAPPEPGAYTYEESKLDRLDEQLAELDSDLETLGTEVKEFKRIQEVWQKSTLEELNKRYERELRGMKINELARKRQLDVITQNVGLRELIQSQYREDRDALAKERDKLNVENALEQRRMTDLKAKLDRLLADVDLLVIPRMTLRNVPLGDRIPQRLYRLDAAQVDAVKDFLKAGKPVLACFGPANEHPEDRMRMASLDAGSGPDALEQVLEQLGIRFGKQTVLFNVESKSFAERRSGFLVSGVNVEVPSVDFTWKPDALRTALNAGPRELPTRKSNPIRSSMEVVANSLGQTLDLRVRHPRPIYVDPEKDKSQTFEPTFMLTSPASWNEEQPFPVQDKTPRFEPTKPEDPAKGTLDEERRGPFPIGVALETKAPADWYSDKDATPATTRIVALGQGGLFVGPELTPAKGQLLLHTCNWLLGLDDLLPKSEREWSYPRLHLDAAQQTAWRWGAWLGLPGLFAYLGAVVYLLRRVR